MPFGCANELEYNEKSPVHEQHHRGLFLTNSLITMRSLSSQHLCRRNQNPTLLPSWTRFPLNTSFARPKDCSRSWEVKDTRLTSIALIFSRVVLKYVIIQPYLVASLVASFSYYVTLILEILCKCFYSFLCALIYSILCIMQTVKCYSAVILNRIK